MKRSNQTKKKPRKRLVHLQAKQKRQPVNKAHWSDASKRSISFLIAQSEYEDIHYQCLRCGRASVFSAIEQKIAYEERQVYIWQRRTLCGECWGERRRVERAIRDCQRRWRSKKAELRRDRTFLEPWLSLLELHPTLGGRRNHAGIIMLQKLIGALK